MSAPIGPGDWVECCPQFWVEKPPYVSLIGRWPSPGGIYEVRETGFLYGTNVPGFRFVGTVASFDRFADAWFPTKHFRPIYRRRDAESLAAKLLEGALSGVPAQVVRERSRETIKTGVSQ